MDIYVRGSTQMVVEIKVNYIDEEEIPKFQKNKRVLPVRITDDLKKIKLIGEDPYFLLLVATVLESPESLRSYKEIVDRDLKKRFNRKEWTWEWYNCSDKKEGGYILLLVIKDEGRLPSEKTVSKVK
jgi:hypothetical protein